MSNLEAQITPMGLKQKNLVDALYYIVSSIKTRCAKLDADGGVPLETYTANVYTAIFNGQITDSRGNQLTNRVAAKDDLFYVISPAGVSDKALLECLYDIFDMFETLTEQLDTDVLTDSNYEALVYTAHFTWIVENTKGNQLGNGTSFYFRPGGVVNQKELVDLLAMFFHATDTLDKKLDLDGTVTDTDYEALCDTAILLMQIQDSKGGLYGNALTTFDP